MRFCLSRRFFLILIAVFLSSAGLASESTKIEVELDALEKQIESTEAVIAQYEGGLIKTIAEMRRETLLLGKALLENVLRSNDANVERKIVVPAVTPDEDKAKELLAEMASAQTRIQEALSEVESAGGVFKVMAITRMETERLTLAQLQMAYLQAQYGIALPSISPQPSMPAPETKTNLADRNSDSVDDIPDWADPDYPDIDYSRSWFSLAHKKGHEIAGWWTIERKKAPIDDSPIVLAINISQQRDVGIGNGELLLARCQEGETSFIFIQDDFLMSGIRESSLSIDYRIDSAPAKKSRWSALTSNKGAGLFGAKAKTFLRELYEAEKLFLRVTDSRSRNKDASFDLAGAQKAIDAVAASCGWSTLELTGDDYRAIQTLLNAAGYDAGVADGQWGAGSRKAMSRFQEDAGLSVTGAPDKASLTALGFGAPQ